MTDGTRGIDCVFNDREVLRIVGDGDISRGGKLCMGPVVQRVSDDRIIRR